MAREANLDPKEIEVNRTLAKALEMEALLEQDRQDELDELRASKDAEVAAARAEAAAARAETARKDAEFAAAKARDRVETARRGLAAGLDAALVAELSGLSEAEVRGL
jgi:hypothetical protein